MNAGVEFIMGETSSIARNGDYRVVSSERRRNPRQGGDRGGGIDAVPSRHSR